MRRSWEIINSFWFFVENGAWSAGGFSVDGDTVEDVSVVVAAILTFALEKEGGGAGDEVRWATARNSASRDYSRGDSAPPRRQEAEGLA